MDVNEFEQHIKSNENIFNINYGQKICLQVVRLLPVHFACHVKNLKNVCLVSWLISILSVEFLRSSWHYNFWESTTSFYRPFNCRAACCRKRWRTMVVFLPKAFSRRLSLITQLNLQNIKTPQTRWTKRSNKQQNEQTFCCNLWAEK